MARAPLEKLLEELQALKAERQATAGGSPPEPQARGEPATLLATARRLAGALVRAGVLLPVEAEDAPGLGGPLFIVRGTTRVIDLGPLGRPGSEAPPAAAAPAVPAGEAPAAPPAGAAGSSASPSGGAAAATGPPTDPAWALNVLDAMEQAQDLRLGDPGGEEREAILEGILGLLSRNLPALRLFVRFPGEGRDRPEAGILYAAAPGEEPPWLATRPAGAAVWIDSELGLPPAMRRILAGATEAAAEPTAPGRPDPGEFHGAAAVPLREPAGPDPREGPPPEAGLLIVTPTAPLPRSELLAAARRLAGFVTRRWRRLRELNQRIHTDGLTGVRNRAYFDGQFALELERARRSRSPLSLVLCDLDHFKAVNDRHGHAVGDRVLVKVAHALQDELRRIDHVCRIGGEEFALILPDTSPDQAREAVARVMRRLDGLELEVADMEGPLRVTISCGAATFPDAGTDSSDLFRKADAMLYRSKRTGRHRCHFWTRHGEPNTLIPGQEP